MNPRLDFLKIVCKGDAKTRARIEIRGTIDNKWDSENYTVTDTEKEVLKLLKAIPEDQDTDVHVSSEGGSVKMALGIHNALRPRAAKLTFHNGGVMFSSATILPPKGSRVITPKSSLYGIHSPSLPTSGTADQLRTAAKSLDAVGDVIAGIYAERTGKSVEACKAMMDRTTLMGGQRAVEEGFADSTGDDDQEPDEDEVIENALAANVTMRFSDLPKDFRARIDAHAAQNKGGHQPPPTPTKEEPKMKKLLAALVEAKLIASAEIDEDLAVTQFRASFGQLSTDKTRMEAAHQSHQAALKLRVTNRVKGAIEAKKIKPEREASLIAMGIVDEVNLDFLDDMTAPAALGSGQRRGSPPAPATGADEDSTDAKIENLLKDLKDERDPLKIANLSRQLRELRGNKDMFKV